MNEEISFGHSTHYDEATQALLYLNALLFVLSLAGRDKIGQYDAERMSVALNGFGRLAFILSTKVLMEVDSMGQEHGEGGER